MSETMLPPLDGSLNVFPDFLDFHARHNSNRNCWEFPSYGNSMDVPPVTFRDFADATHRAAHAIRPQPGPERSVVAILINTDSIYYHVLIVGVIRAGLIPFPMGPRNSAPAIASMLTRTDCHRIVSQSAFSALTDDVLAMLPVDYAFEVTELPPLAEILPSLTAMPGIPIPPVKPYPAPEHRPVLSDIVLYLHSSGSTGFPKPIPHVHLNWLQWCTMPTIESTHGDTWASMMLPSFHMLGVVTQLLFPLATGYPNVLFPPRTHLGELPVIPTPDNTLEAIQKSSFTMLIVVPAFLESWMKDANSLEILKDVKTVSQLPQTFCGGPLSSSAGTKLVEAGIHLYPIYGSTEVGGVSDIGYIDYENPETSAENVTEWEYLRFSDLCNIRWDDQGDGSYELVFMRSSKHKPCVENLPNGEHGYATSDIFVPHPSKPGLWKIIGRTDDVLILSNGEKVVPVQQQNAISTHPLLLGAVMFGRGRDQVGLLVEPKPGHYVAPGDEAALIELRNAIWSKVEEANRIAPAFARIFKEMILVADSSRPFNRAAKGTIMVKTTLALYEKDIDALYESVRGSSDLQGVTPPSSWTFSNVVEWLSQHASLLNDGKVPDAGDDIFQQGFDSLSATYLRNRIMSSFRTSPDPLVKNAAQGVQPNFVFTHPTLASLASAIVNLIDPQESSTSASPVEEINTMIDKYTVMLPKAPITRNAGRRSGAVVLLTGSTGTLGTHILSELLTDEHIVRVYALNRGARLLERQRDAFVAAQLPTDILSNDKLSLLSGDIMREDFGLPQTVLDEIRASTTHIVHNAWKVDFNLSLRSFEAYVESTIRLLNLAPAAHFSYMSSISSAQSWRVAERGPRVPEDPTHDTSAAVGAGYGMSKFVVEEVLSNAREVGLKTTVLRVGQICGSTRNGAWNTSEWVPILVKSSVSLGCLPEMNGVLSWIPVEAVARAAVDVILTPNAPALVNVVHPYPARSRNMLSAIGDALESDTRLPVISIRSWVEKLESVAQNITGRTMEETPAIKLLDFFRGFVPPVEQPEQVAENDLEMGALPLYDTAKMQSISSTMENLQPLGGQNAYSWVKYWRDQRFIP
ncbi:uncharacterized protein FIBRA_03424 [Fibroporia radiculosa]|uniref:Polyketide synthase phosphopantetheine-binding domain-containing protein n=1 Tax=Fibroporia radiculosa TaxID=599839 RepID=J4H2E3_9APHY|nr:uncharacterized protein FIBRA_03424 [Fibroporia radiculosa]CCM01374.1 predicted protein [Fibroporia radiculosa]